MVSGYWLWRLLMGFNLQSFNKESRDDGEGKGEERWI